MHHLHEGCSQLHWKKGMMEKRNEMSSLDEIRGSRCTFAFLVPHLLQACAVHRQGCFGM